MPEPTTEDTEPTIDQLAFERDLALRQAKLAKADLQVVRLELNEARPLEALRVANESIDRLDEELDAIDELAESLDSALDDAAAGDIFDPQTPAEAAYHERMEDAVDEDGNLDVDEAARAFAEDLPDDDTLDDALAAFEVSADEVADAVQEPVPVEDTDEGLEPVESGGFTTPDAVVESVAEDLTEPDEVDVDAEDVVDELQEDVDEEEAESDTSEVPHEAEGVHPRQEEIDERVVEILDAEGEILSSELELLLESDSYYSALSRLQDADRVVSRRDPRDGRRKLYRLADTDPNDEYDQEAEDTGTEQLQEEIVDVLESEGEVTTKEIRSHIDVDGDSEYYDALSGLKGDAVVSRRDPRDGRRKLYRLAGTDPDPSYDEDTGEDDVAFDETVAVDDASEGETAETDGGAAAAHRVGEPIGKVPDEPFTDYDGTEDAVSADHLPADVTVQDLRDAVARDDVHSLRDVADALDRPHMIVGDLRVATHKLGLYDELERPEGRSSEEVEP